MIRIRRGLDLPIAGSPQYNSELSSIAAPPVRSAAVVGFDYHGMKPTMAVQVGDRVKLGQVVFTDKKNPGVNFTAPAAGTVAAVNRGAHRIFQSIVIDLEGDEEERFQSHSTADFAGLSRAAVRDNLVASGMWTAFRTRPYSKAPAINSVPNSIFVTAMDTRPLAADPRLIINEYLDDFRNGLTLLSKLTDGKVYVCTAPDGDFGIDGNDQIEQETFSGPHPSGNPGTHIHFLDPVGTRKTVWHIGYQDVIAFSKLFASGRLFVDRIVSLGGPQVEQPQLIRTRLGANLDEMTAGLLKPGDNRIVSGSLLGGRNAIGPFNYLGRFHNMVSVVLEGRERPFLHYLQAGNSRFSVMPIYLSKLFKNKKFNFTTSTNGSERAMVPIGSYEKVMPMDILPTQLLRALIVGDTETAQQLGCLELDEEDLALCTFVCPGKYEYGPILRDNLARIEKEG